MADITERLGSRHISALKITEIESSAEIVLD